MPRSTATSPRPAPPPTPSARACAPSPEAHPLPRIVYLALRADSLVGTAREQLTLRAIINDVFWITGPRWTRAQGKDHDYEAIAPPRNAALRHRPARRAPGRLLRRDRGRIRRRFGDQQRSEARRVGKEWVRKCRARWAAEH